MKRIKFVKLNFKSRVFTVIPYCAFISQLFARVHANRSLSYDYVLRTAQIFSFIKQSISFEDVIGKKNPNISLQNFNITVVSPFSTKVIRYCVRHILWNCPPLNVTSICVSETLLHSYHISVPNMHLYICGEDVMLSMQ